MVDNEALQTQLNRIESAVSEVRDSIFGGNTVDRPIKSRLDILESRMSIVALVGGAILLSLVGIGVMNVFGSNHPNGEPKTTANP